MVIEKFLWYSDTHFNRSLFLSKTRFVNHIKKEGPKGIFLTGDISCGLFIKSDLEYFAKNIVCPIYFVLGNHDYYYSSFNEIHDQMSWLTKKYKNLIWLTKSEPIELNEEVCLLGTEGWYDSSLGNYQYIKYTTDWFLIKEPRRLPSFQDRIDFFRTKANDSVDFIVKHLDKLFDKYKTIYFLTHFPPWKEATRDQGTFLEPFWLPYNVNNRLGKKIEELMSGHKKRNIIVLAGHTHSSSHIRISKNIQCIVSDAKYFGQPKTENHIYI